MNLAELQFLLKQYNLSPNKVRGQNFLVDELVLQDIIQAADLEKDDLVMEVGPGLGALTQELLNNKAQVVAFEIDKNFKKPLDKLGSVFPSLEIVWQDILSLSEENWQSLLDKHKKNDYKIIANIPYYLTSKFIQKFLSFKNQPKSMTLMIQQEVAERIVSKDNKNSLLSLAVNFYAEAEIVRVVDRQKFYPSPKVDSAVINIFDVHSWSYDVTEKKTWQLIKRGFAKKRKKLFNNLLTDQSVDKKELIGIFENLELDQNIRAERLSKKDWLLLAKKLEK